MAPGVLHQSVASYTAETFSRRAQLGNLLKLGRFFSPSQAPLLQIKSYRPLSYGRFELMASGSDAMNTAIELSADLRTWEIWKELIVGPSTRIFDTRAEGSHMGFVRLRSGRHCSAAFGFLKLDAAPGYNLFGCPFQHATGAISDMLHWLPAGAQVTTYDPILNKLRTTSFDRKWSDPAAKLENGEGFLFLNPTGSHFPVVMSGRVGPDPALRTLPPGTTLRSSMLPLSGDLIGDLHLPAEPGDVVTLFCPERQQYVEHRRTSGGWSEPLRKLRLGEGFWAGKKSAAEWRQSLPSN